ncbi:MAG: hypothetical protein D6683_01945 [Actinomyces sp.]|nr:MAG: hypothetical protein D6683_01945 [Actinomyces sp.]
MSIDSAFASGKAVKFAEVGDTIDLTVVDVTERDTTDFEGNPVKVVVISGTDGDGETRDLWCQKYALRRAIGEAVAKATGRPGAPQPGGRLRVKRVADGQASKPGFAPPHQFAAAYEAPKAAPAKAVDEAFSDDDPF